MFEFDDIYGYDFVPLPEEGFHIMKNNEVIKIKDMKNSHLKNSIKFGKEKCPHGKEDYWDYVVPQFENELKRRDNLTYGKVLEKMKRNLRSFHE